MPGEIKTTRNTTVSIGSRYEKWKKEQERKKLLEYRY